MAIIRICPNCGAENSIDEIMCVRCMADLSNAETVDKSNNGEQTKLERKSKLVLSNNEFKMVFEPDREYILGRDNEGRDYFGKIAYVSRKHAKIFFKDGNWYIEDLGSTNGTYVNGKRVENISPLKEGDTLYLSLSVAFTVNLV